MRRYFRLTAVVLVCAYFWYCAKNYTDWHFLSNVDLIFHEAGHTIFSFFGEFIRIAAGSGFQVFVPLFITAYFYYNEQKISSALCLLWVGESLLNVAVYAGDAVAMQLPLLGGDNSGHDWHNMLGQLGLLNHTSAIAFDIYLLGIITIIVGTSLALYYTWTSEQENKPRAFT